MPGRDGLRRASVAVAVAAAALLGFLAGIAAAVTVAPGWPARVGAATTVPVPATIDASGRSDVTDVLTTFFAGLAPGSTVTFPEGGRFRAEGVVLIVGAVDLTIEGNGATIFATTDGSAAIPPSRGFRNDWPRRREHLELRQAERVRVHDLIVRGANANGGARAEAYVPALEGQAGIAVIRSRDVVLDDVTVSKTYGDLVYVAGGTTGLTVTGSRLTDSGRQGVAIVNGANVRVTGTEISGIARSVFDLEPPGRSLASDIRLDGNRIGEYANFLLAARGGGAGVERVALENNQVSGSHGISVAAGIDRVTRRDLRVTGNRGTARARPVAGYGSGAIIQLTNLDGVIVRDNDQPVAGGAAVSLDRVCRLTIDGNEFSGASREQQVLAACGAAAGPAATTPAPTDATRPGGGQAAGSTSSTGPDPAPPVVASGDDAGDGSSNTGVVVLAASLGVVAGLGIAAAIWWLVRRRATRRPPGAT